MENHRNTSNQKTKESLTKREKDSLKHKIYDPIGFSFCYVSNSSKEFLQSNFSLTKARSICKKNNSKKKKLSRALHRLVNSQQAKGESIINMSDAEFGRYNLHFTSSKSLNSLDKLQSIHTLPRELIKNKIFTGYSTCQIIVHEKGSPVSESFLFGNDDKLNFSQIPANSFSSLFNLVRKSKLKLFSQTNILNEFVATTGSFLAKEMSLKYHNVIIIVSRNDFLPPNETEKNEFEDSFGQIQPILSKLISKKNLDAKYNHLILALENMHFPIAIITSKDEVLIRNSLFDDEIFNKFRQTPDNSFKILSLTTHTKMVFQYNSSAPTIGDIYHFQRISLLGELLNTLRHELSNPLFGINLSTSLFLSETEDEDMLEMIGDIGTASQRCQEIIENFSELYSTESNEIQNFKLANTIKEVLTLSKSVTKGIPRKIDISLNDNENISTYRTWLSQIIFNLVVNAAQAIRIKTDNFLKELITVSAKRVNGYIEITISDSGNGIPADIQSKLFDPFFTTKKGGTGLGLSICQNLAKKIGGQLKLDHSSNEGSSFTLKFKENYESSAN